MSSKDDVFNYVMNSPEDTNPAVLRSLLNGIVEGAVINDDTPSTSTVYSSSKVESIIPANELPEPKSSNNGKIATIVKDGNTYKWGVVNQLSVYTGRIGNTNVFTLDDNSPRRNPTPGISMILTAYKNGGEYITFTGYQDTNTNTTVFTAVTRGTNSTTYHTITKTLDWSDTSLNGATYSSVTINDPA